MIVINDQTARMMISFNDKLIFMSDIYGNSYLMGLGVEILVLSDEQKQDFDTARAEIAPLEVIAEVI
jgi:hypothetical protein